MSKVFTEFVQSTRTSIELTASMHSQKLLGTAVNYCHAILSKTEIYIHYIPTLAEICTQLDIIIQYILSKR